jgi:hypothetical protein
MNNSPPNKRKKENSDLGDSQATSYAAEISSCLGKDIALQLEALITKQNARTH